MTGDTQFEENLRRYASLAVEMGAIEAVPIDAKKILVAEWVPLKCQYGCDVYGKSLTCPPYSPTPERMRQILGCYSRAILMRLPDESMKTHDMITEMERRIFLDGNHSALGLTAGPCERCKKYNLKSCVNPMLARASMEASGIDVYTTVRMNGFSIEVLKDRGREPTYFGLLLVK